MIASWPSSLRKLFRSAIFSTRRQSIPDCKHSDRADSRYLFLPVFARFDLRIQHRTLWAAHGVGCVRMPPVVSAEVRQRATRQCLHLRLTTLVQFVDQVFTLFLLEPILLKATLNITAR